MLSPGSVRPRLGKGWVTRHLLSAYAVLGVNARMSADIVPENLRLPYAFDSRDKLVSAVGATGGEQHGCPNCGDPVTLRCGDVKVDHFAHRPGTNCRPESRYTRLRNAGFWLGAGNVRRPSQCSGEMAYSSPKRRHPSLAQKLFSIAIQRRDIRIIWLISDLSL